MTLFFIFITYGDIMVKLIRKRLSKYYFTFGMIANRTFAKFGVHGFLL